jgi:hypothetical protein
MIGSAQGGLRPQGARTSTEVAGDENVTGTPQTLQGVVEAKLLVVGFFDERGRSQTMVVMDVGGKYYTPPNAIEWCASLRPLAKWITDQIKKKDEANKVPVNLPEEDRVDV